MVRLENKSAKASEDEHPAKRRRTMPLEQDEEAAEEYLTSVGQGQEALEAAIKRWRKHVQGAPTRGVGALKSFPEEMTNTVCALDGVALVREAWEVIDRHVCSDSREPKGFGFLRTSHPKYNEYDILAAPVLEANSALGTEGPRRGIGTMRVEVEEGDNGTHLTCDDIKFNEYSRYAEVSLINPPKREVDISFYSVSERVGGGPPFSFYKNLVVEFQDDGCSRLRKYITYAVTGEAFPVHSKAVAFSASAPLPADLTRLVLDYYGLRNLPQEETQDWGRDRGYMY